MKGGKNFGNILNGEPYDQIHLLQTMSLLTIICWLSKSSFWMQDDFVKVWNIAGVNTNKKKGENARFLTNNALERYNRHFNGIVPSSHPNLVVFAHALREEAKSVSQRLEDVRKGREEAPTYSTSFIEIPKEFHSFKWPPVAVASKKRRVMKK